MLLELSTPIMLATQGNLLLKPEDCLKVSSGGGSFMNWLPLSGKTPKLSTSFLLSILQKNQFKWPVTGDEEGHTVHQQIHLECRKVASSMGSSWEGWIEMIR